MRLDQKASIIDRVTPMAPGAPQIQSLARTVSTSNAIEATKTFVNINGGGTKACTN
jgi:hypothetical protein